MARDRHERRPRARGVTDRNRAVLEALPAEWMDEGRALVRICLELGRTLQSVVPSLRSLESHGYVEVRLNEAAPLQSFSAREIRRAPSTVSPEQTEGPNEH